MHTLDSATRGGTWRRDVLLLWRMAAMLVHYWVEGGRVRWRYRRREARGEIFFVDDEGPSGHREAPLRR